MNNQHCLRCLDGLLCVCVVDCQRRIIAAIVSLHITCLRLTNLASIASLLTKIVHTCCY